MAATESILNKVNVFPSLSSFNDNADAVDSNSLNLIKTGAVLVETYKSGETGYRKWSDGYIEQWGSTSSAQTTVTLPKEMTTTTYSVTIAQRSANDTWSTRITGRATTTFSVGGAYASGIFWHVSGY